MMKSGWKTAKFKDVSTVVGGSTPKTDIPEYWGGDNYWVAPAELDGSKYISSTVKHITDLAVSKTNLTLLPQGTVLLSSRAPIGKVAITTVPMYCNQGFKNIVCGPELFNGYVYYFLKHNVNYLQSLGTGATFKEISKKVVENVSISYPSLAEQQRIVDELDLLSCIIDSKKAQLRDLDALAQSIFYEMFGDPITNSKGWPVKKIGELAHLFNGRAFKPSDWSETGLPIVRIQNLNAPDSPFNYYDGEVDGAYLLNGGELLYAWSGTPGTSFGAHIWNGRKAVLNQHIFKVIFDSAILNKFYFLYQLNLSVSSLFDLTHGGVGLKHITKGTLENQLVPLPSLDLQELFARKIQAIESQKNSIEFSIKQTKSLLDSQMAKYFNLL